MIERGFTLGLPDIPARATVEVVTTLRQYADGSVSQPIVERWISRCLDCGRVIRADGRCGCFWRTRDQWLSRHTTRFAFAVVFVAAAANVAMAIFECVQLVTAFQLKPEHLAECQLLLVLNLVAGVWCAGCGYQLRRLQGEPWTR